MFHRRAAGCDDCALLTDPFFMSPWPRSRESGIGALGCQRGAPRINIMRDRSGRAKNIEQRERAKAYPRLASRINLLEAKIAKLEEQKRDLGWENSEKRLKIAAQQDELDAIRPILAHRTRILQNHGLLK